MAWVRQKEAKVSLPLPSLPPLTQRHQGSEHDLESEDWVSVSALLD